MKQALMTLPGKIEILDVSQPVRDTLKTDEILLKVKRIGVCGSDIHAYHGEHPSALYPLVQGHEYSAQVIAVGSGVSEVKPGMKVTARPQRVCGVCNPCKKGEYNVCQNLRVEGFHLQGSAQDYFVVTHDRLVVLPDGMSYDHGAMVEPVAVAAHATARPRMLKGKNVVVSGAGTIGNLIAQFAIARGAAKVLVTDISDYRLDVAKACGIEHTINVSRKTLAEGMSEVFGAEGYQIGFECAGVESSIQSLMATIEKGSDIIIVGVHAQNPVVDMEHLGERELWLIGSMMYLHEDYLTAVEEISAGRIKLDPIITNHFPLEKYAEAYKFIDSARDKCMKVIIDL